MLKAKDVAMIAALYGVNTLAIVDDDPPNATLDEAAAKILAEDAWDRREALERRLAPRRGWKGYHGRTE